MDLPFAEELPSPSALLCDMAGFWVTNAAIIRQSCSGNHERIFRITFFYLEFTRAEILNFSSAVPPVAITLCA